MSTYPPALESKGRIRLLAVSYVLESVSLLAVSAWYTIINPPSASYGTPPAIEAFAYIFFFVMFGAGVFFIFRAFVLFSGRARPSSSDVIASSLSLPLWFFPALFAIGNAYSLLTRPYIPQSLRPLGFEYLRIGILFVVIGIFNLSSLLLYARTRKK